jgi:streptomycin 6-kinase
MLPTYTQDTLVSDLGQEAVRWVEEFPARVRAAQQRFNVTLTGTLGGSMSACLLGSTTAGSEVVVKLSPHRESLSREALALQHWSASSVVPRLLDQDSQLGALLLERVVPGTPLGFPSAPGPSADPELVGLTLAKLHATSGTPAALAKHPHVVIDHRRRITAQRLHSDPAWLGFHPLVQWALSTADSLHRSALASSLRLIHGDFQAKNLLLNHNAVVAIDPLAGLGDPCFDVALWAVTDLGAPPVQEALDKAASAAGLNQELALLWTLVAAVCEHRPATRPLLSRRIESFLDEHISLIPSPQARDAWLARPTQ